MKKHVYTALLGIALATPAFAQNKFQPSTPDEPLRRRTIVGCMALLVGLHTYDRHFRKQKHTLQMLAAD
ncbi:hypothetical protein [Duganella sp. S19_KUP01_CR8]|uniref:hypothetical protein n=1 Tax=Duganella sp. S19_KUP01_CR8 TaxID=3025502 RepID=UPI002FCDDEA2